MFQRFFLGFVVVLFAGGQVNADLVLTLDTTAKTFWFEDSEGVEFLANPFNAQLGWSSPDFGAVSEDLRVNTATLWSGSNGSPSGAFGGYITAIFFDSGLNSIAITLQNDTGGPNTITGTGMAFQESYAGLSASSQALFESFIGQEIANSTGTASSLSVVSSVVPEPSACLVVSLASVVMVARRRRRWAS